jgi:transcriptional regulator with XRE-family HTH domain
MKLSEIKPIFIGERIKKLRQQKGYTLEILADLADSSKSYIWEIENKNPLRPSAEKLQKIAIALEVTTAYLMGEEPYENAKDADFFRKYQSLHPNKREQVRKILDILCD